MNLALGLDACSLIRRCTDDRELGPVSRADIAIDDLADVKADTKTNRFTTGFL